jgi:hypothetical protein
MYCPSIHAHTHTHSIHTHTLHTHTHTQAHELYLADIERANDKSRLEEDAAEEREKIMATLTKVHAWVLEYVCACVCLSMCVCVCVHFDLYSCHVLTTAHVSQTHYTHTPLCRSMPRSRSSSRPKLVQTAMGAYSRKYTKHSSRN